MTVLQSLYDNVVITDSVFDELDAGKDDVLASVNAAIQQGWLVKVVVPINDQKLAVIKPKSQTLWVYHIDDLIFMIH